MALPPQKMREAVFQLLYSLEEGDCDPMAAIALLAKELAVGKQHLQLALTRVQAIQSHRTQIETAISEQTPEYALERIHSVELNILHVGAYEILFDSSVPPVVAIAEAMRLTRKFSTDTSASFVNAVLDAIYRHSRGLETTPVTIDAVAETAETAEAAEAAG